MKKFLLASAALAFMMTAAGVHGAAAQSAAASDDGENAAQALGSRTRAEITRLSAHGADADRALRLQAEGDQALRRGDTVRAAEDYGRAEEAISVLDRERLHATNVRAQTHRELERTQRAGGVNMAQAESFNQKGDDAFDNGDYTDAEVYYAIARADATTRTALNR